MNNVEKSEVVVRFPPSPTGEIHIGNVRTLLFNFLFARKNNGKIVFRFEDTDAVRSKKEYEQPMLDANSAGKHIAHAVVCTQFGDRPRPAMGREIAG